MVQFRPITVRSAVPFRSGNYTNPAGYHGNLPVKIVTSPHYGRLQSALAVWSCDETQDVRVKLISRDNACYTERRRDVSCIGTVQINIASTFT